MSTNTVTGMVFALIIGLAMIGSGGYMWYEQHQRIDNYESTEGTVLSSGVDSRTDGADYIDVTYEYTVDGETYRSSNVEPGVGDVSMSQSRAEEFVENHPEGGPITVYYNPENPENTYVIKNQNIFFPAMAGFGALFTIPIIRMLVNRLSGDSAQ